MHVHTAGTAPESAPPWPGSFQNDAAHRIPGFRKLPPDTQAAPPRAVRTAPSAAFAPARRMVFAIPLSDLRYQTSPPSNTAAGTPENKRPADILPCRSAPGSCDRAYPPDTRPVRQTKSTVRRPA